MIRAVPSVLAAHSTAVAQRHRAPGTGHRADSDPTPRRTAASVLSDVAAGCPHEHDIFAGLHVPVQEVDGQVRLDELIPIDFLYDLSFEWRVSSIDNRDGGIHPTTVSRLVEHWLARVHTAAVRLDATRTC